VEGIDQMKCSIQPGVRPWNGLRQTFAERKKRKGERENCGIPGSMAREV